MRHVKTPHKAATMLALFY